MGLSLKHGSIFVLLALFSVAVSARDIRFFSRVNSTSAAPASNVTDGKQNTTEASSPEESYFVEDTKNDGHGLYSHDKDTGNTSADQQQQKEDDKYVEDFVDDTDDGYSDEQQGEEDDLVKKSLDGYGFKPSGTTSSKHTFYVQQEQDQQRYEDDFVKKSLGGYSEGSNKYANPRYYEQTQEEDDLVKKSLGGYGDGKDASSGYYNKRDRDQQRQQEEDDLVKKSLGGYGGKYAGAGYLEHGEQAQQWQRDEDELVKKSLGGYGGKYEEDELVYSSVYDQRYGKQGMSDTRYLDNGKYFDDVQKDNERWNKEEQRYYDTNSFDHGGYARGSGEYEYRPHGRKEHYVP